jgi:hypothetical protein
VEAQENLSAVVEKIRKILALGRDRGATESEAATAMAKAQELMARYNLDMALVEASGKKVEADRGGERTKEKVKGRAMYKWQQKLAKYVSDVNYVYHFIQESWEWSAKMGRHKKVPQHVFVGRQANVVTAQIMYEYLCETIERLVPIADNKLRLSRSAMSWKEGCADRLCQRLRERKHAIIREQEERMAQEAAAAASGGGTAMVLASQYFRTEVEANYEFAYGYAPGELARIRAERVSVPAPIQPELSEKEKAAEHRRWQRSQEREQKRQEREWAKKDHAAYFAGSEAGKHIGLDAQIGEDGEE